jgi:bacterial leucyl aminopeptidase
MKSFLALLHFACIAAAMPVFDQQPLASGSQYPGFSLDLNDMRLVQLEGRSPVWMSEWEKVPA